MLLGRWCPFSKGRLNVGPHRGVKSCSNERTVYLLTGPRWLAAYEAAADSETRNEWALAGRKHVASNYSPESQLVAIEQIMARS
ncbi:MAG TPA: hypothetical protein D7H88_02695 [Candidatus Poseidoniales archaeon]|nr:MAG TPA: hypothetical protein D7H88_02695 [Candidatus Poseidoniales archaeon]